jgi:transketolase
MKRRMLSQAYKIGYSHMPSALSALPIIREIYAIMNRAHDVFILSKGHGAYGLYAVLEDYGLAPNWQHHEPSRDAKNGVVTTGGSLGHGLPIACGIAFAKQITGNPGKVHVLLGDGECAEGTTWESILFAGRFLQQWRLTVHIDANQYQAISKTIYSVKKMLSYSGVRVIIHHGVKGDGIGLFKDRPDVHVKPIKEEEYNQAMEELK